MNEQAHAHLIGLTIDELAAQTGVSVRTIRYYIAEGLLAGPGTRGKGAVYGDEQVQRLRLIGLLSEQRVPLAQIRARLRLLSPDEVRALVAEEKEHNDRLRQLEETSSPKAYLSALLRSAKEAYQPSVQASWKSGPRGSSARPEAQPPTPEEWRHWQLAPGVELHVRVDDLERSRDLITRLLHAASDSREP